MATLADLRDALFPDAASVGSEVPGRDGVTVGWVRVLRARVPALDVLEAADLVVVPAAALAVVAPTTEQRRDLAQTFAGARVAGALLVMPDERVVEGRERQADAGMAELAVALRDVSVPAYRVVRTEPGALERTVIGFLVDRRGEIERQAAELEGRVAPLALAGRGVRRLGGGGGG